MVPVTCFAVQAAASPQVLLRVFDLLARHGVMPARCHAQVEPGQGLLIDLQVQGVDPRLARRLRVGLANLVEVEDVLVGGKCAAV